MNELKIVGHNGLVGELVLHRPAGFILQRNEELIVKHDKVMKAVPDLSDNIQVCFCSRAYDRLGLFGMQFDKILGFDQSAKNAFDRFRVLLDVILLSGNVECFGIDFTVIKNNPVSPELPLDLSQREVPGTDCVNLFFR